MSSAGAGKCSLSDKSGDVKSTPAASSQAAPAPSSVYEFTAKDIQGRTVRIGDIAEGKVVLFVNTASGCGYTPVYKQLQSLYDKYKGRGFVVVGE